MLDSGILSYGKSASEVNRGRTHGRIDVGQAVISAKTELFRIDIDDEAFLHHLKVRKCSKICMKRIYLIVWNFQDFSVTQILREINFEESNVEVIKLLVFFCHS